ncbi:TPA: methyltransferase domain-containing protein [Candidatus Poribacteria bacterium]|nr:methyltransferase domain-containing protein [Candidatus Poribacteria bacterium]HIB91030.1 methyltransferase domain-containing protein [Candidatus Poribacteria bacterium]HIB99705.1 methyltransferase domain-containing protein [Candidatus Poribacteria bacterium]HIO07445.1 methyltransferase domain-containing protein [Candidatus Poribacteria bacterium]HIO81727.1 methyltransferase domain-containing protein [Candidatus Poribacteria bacterium]
MIIHHLLTITNRIRLNSENSLTYSQLDTTQYTVNGILRYEKVFGYNFVSTGGIKTAQELFSEIDLTPGAKVLDIGSGLGGSAFFIEENYAAKVTGIDLSSNMIQLSNQRASYRNSKVQFILGDCTQMEFEPESFNLIYSRDSLLHVQDKTTLFQKIKDWLKPSGKVLITDYCCGSSDWSREFSDYVQKRNYTLHDVQTYKHLLEKSGLKIIQGYDNTKRFVVALEAELQHLISMKEEFLQNFTQHDYEDLIQGWEKKITRAKQGYQKWGCFYAKKN